MPRTIRKAPYDQTIREVLAEIGLIGAADPRHIEGYMRLQYGTLDHLTRAQFRAEVQLCVQCVKADGIANAERLAQSFGY